MSGGSVVNDYIFMFHYVASVSLTLVNYTRGVRMYTVSRILQCSAHSTWVSTNTEGEGGGFWESYISFSLEQPGNDHPQLFSDGAPTRPLVIILPASLCPVFSPLEAEVSACFVSVSDICICIGICLCVPCICMSGPSVNNYMSPRHT